ncbi:MAG: type II secretion system protein [Fibrobacter sp.]|nr:type II secretion system protein [Fibrobacter sp.]
MCKMLKNKSGFGIVEVLVSAVVLGFLLTALLNLQGGNRDTLLRLRGRDGAVEVAQSIIDSLNRSGLTALGNANDTTLYFCDSDYDCSSTDASGGKKNNPNLKTFMQRTWEGQPGLVKNTMTVDYRAVVNVSKDSDYRSEAESNFETLRHVYAKQVNVSVFWKFKGTEHSINVSGVVK